MPASSFRVLVIDDNEGDLRLIEEAIVETGAPIALVTCRSAVEALTLLEQDRRFDLILSDLNMPRMSGIELFDQLAQRPEFQHIPMVLMSSSQRERLPAKLGGTVSTPYFTKAGTWDDFLRLVREMEGVLSAGKAPSSGRYLAERMTPPAGFAKFIAPEPPPPQ